MNPAPKTAAHLDPVVRSLREEIRETRREVRALRRKLGAPKPPSLQAKRTAWHLRIRFLQSLHAEAGHISKAAEAAGIRRQRAYKHKGACQLFADCWEYIRAYTSVRGTRADWSEVWPAQLADPQVEALAGVSGLPSRLIEAGVMEPADMIEEAA